MQTRISTGSDALPWYRRVYRWGQTNLTERDPIQYDGDWWREHWRRTRIQGVIVNAGGIVAYYPSALPFHHRAQYLGERDLYGEIVDAARAEGLAVLARMDSNRADEAFYATHPDWFAVDAAGLPYRAGDRYVACVNSPYYDEFLPAVLREIIARSHPDGFGDNSWSGLDRGRICYCTNCAEKFHVATGLALPRAHDWDDPAYRHWIAWSYARRVEIWEANNRVARKAGGPDCLWIGMNSGDIIAQCERFRDYKAICERAEMILLDSQTRTNARGFQANAEMGTLIHGLLGWEKLIPESMAMYGAGQPAFRVASKPEAEVRLWAVEGFAGTIQPWWHHIGAYHDDRRQYRTAEPLFRWHETNEEFLINRRPIASVGVVWTQENVDYYGRDAARERVELPQRGLTNALIRARIPSLPIHADHIERDGGGLAALVLPNVGALSDAQCTAIRAFVKRGGGLLATGETSRYDMWGEPRPDFALADIFGVHSTGAYEGGIAAATAGMESWDRHTYLRLTPERRAEVYGPHIAGEPAGSGERHTALRGFEDTDILPFGGRIEIVRRDEGTEAPLTYIPPFPMYPPEFAWIREERRNVAALVLTASMGRGRAAYLAADIDRCYGRDNLPDHAALLENLVRWVANDRIPLAVAGAGLIDCHLYHQPGRLILHLVNLTNVDTWRAPVHELIPVGPFAVRVQLPSDVAGRSARLLVGGETVSTNVADRWASFDLSSVRDHEVVVVS